MDICELKITKAELQTLTDFERILVLQFGHVCNELTFLSKLLIVVNDANATGLEKTAMDAQAMIVIRLYIGKLFEAWRMLERDYLRNQLSRSLVIDPIGAASLQEMKAYFGRKNLLCGLRNNFSFHYSSKHLSKAMDAFDDSREFQLFCGETYTNTLHSYSEEFVTVSMLEASGEKTLKLAMNKIGEDLVFIGGKMIDFLGYSLAAIFEYRLGKSRHDLGASIHKIEPKENIEAFRVPFFFQVDG